MEVGYDIPAATLSLWINGQAAGSSTLPANAADISRCFLGGIQKDESLSGEIFLDEWVTSDEYISPVVVEPASEFADAPARWLVIYNTTAPESSQWADSYRDARRVPHANCLGLPLSLSESISTVEYEDMLGEIEAYLNRNGLRPQVMGILVGYGVPGYAVPPGTAFNLPILSLLHYAEMSLFSTPNPAAAESIHTRPRQADLSGVRFTARIDAPNLASANRFHERSLTLTVAPLGAQDRLYFDPTTAAFGFPEWTGRAMDWYRSLDRQRLHIHSTLSGDPDADNDAQFSAIDRDAFYWGWGPATPPENFFGEPEGSRVACVQLRTVGVAATALRSVTPGHWIDIALDAGYAAAVGSSLSYSPDSLLYARSFFEALRRDWTLAEAYLLAAPRVQDGLYLVGDPLLRVQLPKAGWDVFGPLSGGRDLEPQTPAASLPTGQLTLKLSADQLPDENDGGLYLVRQIDDEGRSEANFRPLRVGRHDNFPARMPSAVAWPNHDYWSFKKSRGVAIATLVFATPIDPYRLSAAALINDVNSTSINADLETRPQQVSVEIDLPPAATRYRWRLTSADGLTSFTPWSAPSTASPTLLEPA